MTCNTCFEYNALNGIQISTISPQANPLVTTTTTRPDPRTFVADKYEAPRNQFPPIQQGGDLSEERVNYGGTNWLLIGLLVAGAGVAGWLGYKYLKGRK